MKQTHLERALIFIRGAFRMLGNGLQEFWKVIMAHKRVSAVVAVLIIAGSIAVPMFLFKNAPPEELDGRREVALVRIGDISGAEPLSIIGEVRSKREALVAPDISGTVSGVYRSLGDVVGAGAIIAELSNSSQKASVEGAKAALEKTKSAVTVGGIGISNAEVAFQTSRESALSAIESAYAVVEDAIARKADQMFSNPSSNQPRFNVTVSNSQFVYTLEAKRLAMTPILTRHQSASTPSETDALISELERLQKEVADVADFLGTLVTALSGAIATGNVTDTDIATFRAEANAGLSAVNAVKGSLSLSIQDLKTKRSAVDIAKENLALGNSGQSADIAAAEANLLLAQSALEKTVIRAPISGTINRLDVEIGNFVTASVPVVYITNPGGLEIVAYVSGRDLGEIVVGAKATVGGSLSGTVVRTAQALDPLTKKAEIRIGIPTSLGLVSGQSTTIAIERTVRAGGATLSIPLSALKITPDGAQVFTVDDTNIVVAHVVQTGMLRGSTIEIVSGATADMFIIEDARGLKEGQEVIVRQEVSE